MRTDHESRRPRLEFDPLPDVTGIEILVATIGGSLLALVIGAIILFGCSRGM